MDLQITGLAEVQEMFRNAPSLAAGQVLYNALDRAGGVVAAEVEERCPDGEEEELRENIIVVTGVDVATRGGTSLVGFNTTASERTDAPMDAIALWVEFGHEMVTHDGKHVGQVPAHPFIRPAFDASGDQAMQVFANTLIDGLSQVLPMEKE